MFSTFSKLYIKRTLIINCFVSSRIIYFYKLLQNSLFCCLMCFKLNKRIYHIIRFSFYDKIFNLSKLSKHLTKLLIFCLCQYLKIIRHDVHQRHTPYSLYLILFITFFRHYGMIQNQIQTYQEINIFLARYEKRYFLKNYLLIKFFQRYFIEFFFKHSIHSY